MSNIFDFTVSTRIILYLMSYNLCLNLKIVKRILLCLCFLIHLNSVFCQNDTLNKRNAKGKKDGYWKVYFDQNVLSTDSANAFFYGFQLYDNGFIVYSFKNFKNKRKLKLKHDSSLPEKGKPVAITGNFYWYLNDTILIQEESYLNGFPLTYRYYYQRSTDKAYLLGEIADFTKKYENIPGTFHFVGYSLYTDKTWEYYYRKDKKKWKMHRVK